MRRVSSSKRKSYVISQLVYFLHQKLKKYRGFDYFSWKKKTRKWQNGIGFEEPPLEEGVKLDLDEGLFPDVNQTKEETIPEFYTFLEISFEEINSFLVASIKLYRLVSFL